MRKDSSPNELKKLEAARFPQLAMSVYLPVDNGARAWHYRDIMTALLQADAHKLTRAERAAALRELVHVTSALTKHRFECPTIAVFASVPHNLLSIWRLPDPVPAGLYVGETLMTGPLRRLFLEHPPVMAAIVDQNRARIFSMMLDEVTELADIEGRPVNHHRQAAREGGSSAATIQSRSDEHARENLEDVARSMEKLWREGDFTRLIIAGNDRARGVLKEVLPPAMRKSLVAEGKVPMYMPVPEMERRLEELNATPAAAGGR